MTDNVDVLVGKVADLLDKATGPGTEAAIAAARVDAYSCLSGAGICAVVACAAIYGVRKWWPLEPKSDYDIPVAKIGAGLLFIVACISGIMAIWAVADPWTWTTIQHPELWLAKRLLGL